MKKIFNSLVVVLLAVTGLSLTSCSDDDESTPISYNDLPYVSQQFIVTYFPWADVEAVYMEGGEYNVNLSDGTDIEFNLSGEWTDVDAMIGVTLPTGFYPSAIDMYISENIPGGGINEISRNVNGYEVELVDGQDLIFNLEGIFIGMD
ncbi:MAG: PepSY-like domain-containing protein [Muribaculaceae bacterium]|nr:PepSY-like domain-containing protein [Muribaculaceae bacterium]